MTINEAEETFPLLECNKKNEFFSNAIYQSDARRINEMSRQKTASCSNNPLHDSHKSGRSLWDNSYGNVSFSPTSKIVYSWTDLSVFCPAKSTTSESIWKKINPLKSRKNYPRKWKQILNDAYGAAFPGELLAILGSSGAGKTTLLNALTFQSDPSHNVKGYRYLNGSSVNSAQTIAKISAYVEQDHLFIGTLTVKEHLIFQALIRMGRDVPYRQKLKRVEEVIEELSLEKCRNTVIGYPGRTKGISGGEMKRLLFASEVLTNPPIMFCDEPTSGLDSFMALNVISILKTMAAKGKTVIFTIHQPSSEIFSLFDKILILAEGRTAFLGRPNDGLSFFAELGAQSFHFYNPADFFIEMLAVVPNQEERCRETIKLICDSFDQSSYGLQLSETIKSSVQNQVPGINREFCEKDLLGSQKDFTYQASWILQFAALFWRSWISIIKEPLLIKVRLFQTVVLSLVVGLIYHQQKLNEDGVMNINGVLFTFLTNMTFQNLFAVISVFCSELPIFRKEHSKKLYRVDTYFLSKTLAEVPMFLAIPVIFVSITYFWINLNSKLNHFLITISIMVLVTNAATSFGYLISCLSTNVVMALSVGPPIIIPFLLFGGFLLNFKSIPSYFIWLSYFSWFRHGNEALLVNQWADIDKIECNRSNNTCPRNGNAILDIYNFQKDNIDLDIVSLFLLIVLFRLLAFLVLFLKTLRRQKM